MESGSHFFPVLEGELFARSSESGRLQIGSAAIGAAQDILVDFIDIDVNPGRHKIRGRFLKFDEHEIRLRTAVRTIEVAAKAICVLLPISRA